MPGDANLDGDVDTNDLTIVLGNFGRTAGVNWIQGDFNGDGRVDMNDLTSVLANFGTSSWRACRPCRNRPAPSLLASPRSACWASPGGAARHRSAGPLSGHRPKVGRERAA